MPKLKTLAVGTRFRDGNGDDAVVLAQTPGGQGVAPYTRVMYDNTEFGECTEYGNDDVTVLDPKAPTAEELVDRVRSSRDDEGTEQADEGTEQAIEAIRARLISNTSRDELTALGIALLDLVIDLITGAP